MSFEAQASWAWNWPNNEAWNQLGPEISNELHVWMCMLLWHVMAAYNLASCMQHVKKGVCLKSLWLKQ